MHSEGVLIVMHWPCNFCHNVVQEYYMMCIVSNFLVKYSTSFLSPNCCWEMTIGYPWAVSLHWTPQTFQPTSALCTPHLVQWGVCLQNICSLKFGQFGQEWVLQLWQFMDQPVNRQSSALTLPAVASTGFQLLFFKDWTKLVSFCFITQHCWVNSQFCW